MEATIAHALPQSCFLPGMTLFIIRVGMLPRLKAAMTDEAIIAASKGEQPHLDQMRQITCRGCNETRCPLGFRQKEIADSFNGLKKGGYMERIGKAEQLLFDLLPKKMQLKLSQGGIKVLCGHMPSRKNPLVWFTLSRGGKTLRIDCEVGKRILRTNEGEQPLTSVEQVGQKIEEATTALL